MPFPPIALSTCWSSHRHSDGYQMIKEMVALGFRHVELSHGIKITLVEGILRAMEERLVEVVSCHNFCPLPPGIRTAAPNLYVPSSPDERERRQWLRHTRRSIDFAAQVRARILVLHLGRMDFFWSSPIEGLQRRAGSRPREELLADPDYQARQEKARHRLRAKSDRHWPHVAALLQEVLPMAADKGIRLVFENRERADELPIDADFGGIFAALGDAAAHAGYWHDTGHAQLKHQAGWIDARTHLAAQADRLSGFHLHDVDDAGHDHQAMGTGRVDWPAVAASFRPEHHFVIELSPRCPPEQVLDSRRYLEGLFRSRGWTES